VLLLLLFYGMMTGFTRFGDRDEEGKTEGGKAGDLVFF
jgi:hypothetical protein